MKNLFAEMEKALYSEACKITQEAMKKFLQDLDEEIFKQRDKKKFYVLGRQKSVVKTVFGEVAFERRKYQERDKHGCRVKTVYLLDEALGIYGVGKISKTLSEIIITAASNQSYRKAADEVSAMTGQVISHAAVWNAVQEFGRAADEREKAAVKLLKKEIISGKEETPVLFEEIDGVWLNIQGVDRRKRRRKSQELKVSLTYSGCSDENGCKKLVGKVAFAGFYTPKEFHKRREAMIRSRYNIDEVKLRVLGGDGASWIRETYDKNTVYQLDRFHISQAVTRSLKHKKVKAKVNSLLQKYEVRSCLSFLRDYRDGFSGSRYKTVDNLLSYLESNKEGLLPYQKRARVLAPPPGLVYKTLGTMENHNYSIITCRMKHNRSSWSRAGATNMAKVLTAKENNTIKDIISGMNLIKYDNYHYDIQYETQEERHYAKEKSLNGEYRPEIHLPILNYCTLPEYAIIMKTLEGEYLDFLSMEWYDKSNYSS